MATEMAALLGLLQELCRLLKRNNSPCGFPPGAPPVPGPARRPRRPCRLYAQGSVTASLFSFAALAASSRYFAGSRLCSFAVSTSV